MGQNFYTGINNRSQSISSWLDKLEVNFEALRSCFSGISFPSSPIEGQLFYKTDEKAIYIYEGNNWMKIFSRPFNVDSAVEYRVSQKNSDDILDDQDNVILVDCSSGKVRITLPSASSCTGRRYYVKKKDNTSNIMEIIGRIEDSNSYLTSIPFDSIILISDGERWYKW